MLHTENIRPEFSTFHHVGVVVRDMEKAVAHYNSLGIGPFEPVSTPVASKTLRGKPAEHIKAKGEIAPMGHIYLELVQPIEGQSLHQEFLDAKGEGINHICFEVENIEVEKGKLLEKGFEILSTVTFVHGGGNVYFDTGEIGGVLVELLQQPNVTNR